MCQNPVPGSIPPPAVESIGAGLPRSVALRQVPPGRAGAHLPQDAVDDGAVVAPLAAAPTARWEQRRDDPPGLLRQLPTSYHHASLVLYCFRTRVTHPVRFVRQTLIPHLSWWARGVQGRAPAGGVTMTRVRPATPTVAFIDQYCAHYRGLFHNVRHFEQFTALHLGLLAETRRKSLPRLGTTVHTDPQALHHFLAQAEWSVEAVRHQRLALLRQALGETPFILCLDETGDRKNGHTTDYPATQYIGNLHGLANGIVSVNAYGVLDTTTFPLLFRLFK